MGYLELINAYRDAVERGVNAMLVFFPYEACGYSISFHGDYSHMAMINEYETTIEETVKLLEGLGND